MRDMDQRRPIDHQVVEFAADLRFISIQLNNQEQYAHWHLFYTCQSYTIFTKWFGHIFMSLGLLDDESLDNYNDEILRDLLEIIFKMVSRSLKFNDHFICEGLFQHILNLFENQRLMQYLHFNFIQILFKVLRIFYYLSKNIYFSDECVKYVNINTLKGRLKANIEFLKNLSTDADRSENNAVYRMYIVCLSYLQERLDSGEIVIDEKDSEILAKMGVVQYLFEDKTSDEFKKKSKSVEREFINEANQIEVGRVNNLISIANRNTQLNVIPSYLLPDLLHNRMVMWSTENKSETIKKMGYFAHQNFYRSIIFYGYDTEKLLALKILKNFCSVTFLRVEIFKDKELIDFLVDLKQRVELESSDSIKMRLNDSISTLFKLKN